MEEHETSLVLRSCHLTVMLWVPFAKSTGKVTSFECLTRPEEAPQFPSLFPGDFFVLKSL